MLELELLEETAGTLKKTTGALRTANTAITSVAHRRRQKQILLKSLHSLENDPIESRNHSATTVAIDPRRLPEAKQRILKFQADMAEFLMSGPKAQVYELIVNLIPLSPVKERQ
jgi:hypothetical protein